MCYIVTCCKNVHIIYVYTAVLKVVLQAEQTYVTVALMLKFMLYKMANKRPNVTIETQL